MQSAEKCCLFSCCLVRKLPPPDLRKAKRIDTGSTATVFEYKYPEENHSVAIKVVDIGTSLAEQLFYTERDVLRRCFHDNIVHYRGFGIDWFPFDVLGKTHSGKAKCGFIVMEYVPKTLADYLMFHPSKTEAYLYP